MSTLRFLTAGESHGPGLTIVVEGIPAGLPIDEEYIRQGSGPAPGRLRSEGTVLCPSRSSFRLAYRQAGLRGEG